MSDATFKLALPLIQEAQAQKHIIHNEALQALDALVQAVALDRDRTEPPTSSEEGDCHLVAAGASGPWSGQDGAVAVFVQNGWTFHQPMPGWRVHVLADGGEAVFDGTAWIAAVSGGSGGGVETVDTLGVNATADTFNRLAVAAPATLFNHEGAGHQVKVNKAAPTDEAAFLFQTNFGGRALIGLLGNDDFSFKVSSDGSTFHTGLVLDRNSGAVQFPNGFQGTGSPAGAMGGQVFTATGARATAPSIGDGLSFGDGGSTAAGMTVPFAGKIVAASLSVSGGTAGVTTFAPAVNGVDVGAATVSVDYSGSGVGTGIADLLATPVAVAAGDTVSLICTATGGGTDIVGTLFLLFD